MTETAEKRPNGRLRLRFCLAEFIFISWLLTGHHIGHDLAYDIIHLRLSNFIAAYATLSCPLCDHGISARVYQVDQQGALGILANGCLVRRPGAAASPVPM
jgi:hypothetical protein